MLDMQSPAMKLLSSGGSSGVLGPSDVPPDNALIARDAWQMQRPEDREVSLELLERISRYDHDRVHRRLSRKRLAGTGEWFLSQADFQAWSAGNGHHSLWCSGIVGSGKTMIATAVVDFMKEKLQRLGQATVYFYCETAQRELLKASDLFESFSKQLLSYLTTIHKRCPYAARLQIRKFYETSEVAPDEGDVSDVFSALFSHVPATTYIIDGLDEFNHVEVSKVLNVFRNVFRNAQGQKIFISSRKELDRNIDMMNFIPGTVNISISSSDIEKDVELYIESMVRGKTNHDRRITEDPALTKQIMSRLLNGAKGMFLWVQLQIEALWEECFTDNEVLSALDNLPVDLESTYHRCLERIEARSGNRHFAVKVFKWVGCASRPLHIEELREATAFDLSDHTWDPGKIPTSSLVISCCANLVVLDTTDQCVRFAHPSVKQYLSDNWQESNYPYFIQQDQGQLGCGEFCINYLSFPIFGLQLQSRPQTSTVITNPLPGLTNLPLGTFVSSAARLMHSKPFSSKKTVRVLTPSIEPQTIQPDTSKYKFVGYATENWALDTRLISSQSPVWRQFRKLAILPVSGWNVHPWTSNDRTQRAHLHAVLGWATKNRHIPLLDILLSLDESYCVRDFCNVALINGGLPPLHLASRLGYDEVVRLLLNICAVNALDSQGRTALHYAAEKGQAQVGRLLLATKGVEVDPLTNFRETPLWLAATSGETQLVTLLLQNKADYTIRDGVGVSSLESAVRNHHVTVIQVLLDAGVDVNAKNGKKSTVLHTAAYNGSEDMVILLLSAGANLNARNESLDTPLHNAAMKGHTNVAKVLLDLGAHQESQNFIDETPLLCSAKNGHKSIAQLLLENGADVEAKDKGGWTSLLEAANSGHAELTLLLLAYGADIETQHEYHGTALQIASRKGYIEMVYILLDHGATAGSGCGYFGYPLQAASACGHYLITKALLGKANSNQYGGHYSSALHAASYEGHDQIVRLLLDYGANINAQADTLETPLIMAIKKHHLHIVKILLEMGADVNIEGGIFGSALQAASYEGLAEIVISLISYNAQVDADGGLYGTALQAASFSGNVQIVRLLLDAGADVNIVGGRFDTALQAASEQDHGQIVKCLLEHGAKPFPR